MTITLPKIYPITDPLVSGLSHARQADMLISGGARFIQLRDKYATAREFYYEAAEAVELARQHGVEIIINDRVDIALALGTGVHLGQNDLPPQQARELLGSRAIIGYSTHSTEQARTACTLPIDYVAIGPIFPTRTKADPDEVVGLVGLRAAREVTGTMPLVAIGGIGEAELLSVYEAGADSAALVSALATDDIAAQFHLFTDLAASLH